MILIISLAPVIILLIYIYRKDRYEKEPLKVLLLALLGGVLSAIATITLFSIVPINFGTDESIAEALTHAFAGAAIPEEIFKFLFLYWFIWHKKTFNEYFDGIVYAVFVSLGFAALENIMYVSEGGLAVGATRAILSVPAHALFAIPMGYYFSLARFSPKNKRKKHFIRGISLAILAHGIFDFILMYLSANETSSGVSILATFLFFAFNVLMYRLAFRLMKKHLNASVFKSE